MDHDATPPGLAASFFKGHGLGNDYLVFGPGDAWVATPANVRRVCSRHRGVGSDGIVAVTGPGRSPYPLRMFNPDGSEFERSGNGLRIFAAWAVSRGDPSTEPIEVVVGGDGVTLRVHDVRDATFDVSVEMGRAETGPRALGMSEGTLDEDGRMIGPSGSRLHVVPVRIGNPHLVVLGEDGDPPAPERLAELGPFLAAHPSIPEGANVQLADLDAGAGPGGRDGGGSARCRAVVWERGVGPTEASGTSACAVAVAVVQQGKAPPGTVEVTMPGGRLSVVVSEGLDVRLRGPVESVFEGRLDPRLLATFEPGP